MQAGAPKIARADKCRSQSPAAVKPLVAVAALVGNGTTTIAHATNAELGKLLPGVPPGTEKKDADHSPSRRGSSRPAENPCVGNAPHTLSFIVAPTGGRSRPVSAKKMTA